MTALQINVNACGRCCFYSLRSFHSLFTVIYPQFLSGSLAVHVKDCISSLSWGRVWPCDQGQANKIQEEVLPDCSPSFKNS